MNTVELKKVGDQFFSEMLAFGVKYKSRAEVRSAIIARLRIAATELDEKARRVIGDHVMALFGYGGGL